MIPALHLVPDSPAPQPRKWNGGIKFNAGTIQAVYDDGTIVPHGSIVDFSGDGTLFRYTAINPCLGFKLDGDGRIMLSADDPLMRPRSVRQRFEFRCVRLGEWYWRDGCRWSIAAIAHDDQNYIVAIGATEAPKYPPGCEPIESDRKVADNE